MVSIAWFLANCGIGKLCWIEMYASYLVQFTAFLSQRSQNTHTQKCIPNIVVRSLLRQGYWHAWSDCSWWKSDWTEVPRWAAPTSRTVAVHALPEYCRPFWTRSLYKYFLSQYLVLIGFHINAAGLTWAQWPLHSCRPMHHVTSDITLRGHASY